MREVASRGGKADDEAPDAEDDWVFEWMVSADELAAFGVRGMLKKTQHICTDGYKAVATFVLEVIDLSRKEVETKRNNANLLDHTNDLIIKLDKSRTSERLPCKIGSG